MEQSIQQEPVRKWKNVNPPPADILQWQDQDVAVFSPRPLIKTEQIFVNSCPPMKPELADNAVYSEVIKCEPGVDYKVEPILLTLKTEPVDPELLGVLPDCDNLAPIECSSSVRDSSNPSSLSFPQNGELNACYLNLIY